MNTKKCFKCGNEKPLTEFYRHPRMSDGLLGKCKECARNDVRQNRADNINYYREYDMQRDTMAHRVAAKQLYSKTENGKVSRAKSNKKWAQSNIVKRSAHFIVANALRSGTLIKANTCDQCGKLVGALHGHHDDYTKPLEVRWLCSKCHRAWHNINGEGKY